MIEHQGLAIRTVSDAVGLLSSPEFRTLTKPRRSASPEAPIYNEPFGVWFRGQDKKAWKLTPSVFRGMAYARSNTTIAQIYLDETSMVYHFMQRAGGLGEHCRNTLDWLCLMRHFQLPTRLLDWSENFLVALFFACKGSPREPGRLFVLNARKLNFQTRKHPLKRDEVTSPWGVEPALRAEMARARTAGGFQSLVKSLNRDYITNFTDLRKVQMKLAGNSEERRGVLADLATPVAVFPRRHDTRMILQQSVFTVHGGKVQRPVKARRGMKPSLPPPIGLEELSEGLPPNLDFLLTVPVTGKYTIQRELKYMGIHDGALSPELDKQAEYIERQWTFQRRRR